MKNHPFNILLFFTSLLMLSCASPQRPMNVYDMAGLWQSTDGPLLYEEWHITSDSNLQGISFSVNQADTLMLEAMRIAFVDGEWYFFARMPDEGESDETAFARNQQEKLSWVFENADNEYPNRVIYSVLSDSSLYARIENMRGNKQKEFHFKRLYNDVQPTDLP